MSQDLVINGVTYNGVESISVTTKDGQVVQYRLTSGIELPELLNEGNASDLMKGKQLINGKGAVVNGSFSLDSEMTAQDSLIAQIKLALAGKAAGEGGLPKQEKTADITENGSVEILPDDGYVLSKVVVNVDVEGSTNTGSEEVASLLGNTMTELNNSIVTSLRTRACQGATKLVAVNLPSVTSLGSYAFYQCTGLVTVKLPKLTSVSTQAFYGSTSLKHADCGQLANIPAQTFNACPALTELILRKTNSICALTNTNGVNNTPIGKGTGYVYVPSALVDSYKTDANWSTFADQFRAIEDYPDICG